jgi:hypothetical protein
MVNRKKPRNTAIGRGVVPRLIGEGRPSDREGSTWGGRVTVRRIDGQPVEPANRPTVAPLRAAASKRQPCPTCGKVATPNEYVDRVRLGNQTVLRHVLCRPGEVAANGTQLADEPADGPFSDRRPVTALLPREGWQVDAFATATRGSATRVVYVDSAGTEQVAWVPSEGVRPRGQ